MKRYFSFLMLVVSGCPVGATTASLDVQRVGGTTFTTTAGAKSFSVTATSGSIAIAQFNLVDFEDNDETTLIGEPVVFDFVNNELLSILPVIVAPATYEQVHVIPDQEQVTLSMTVEVELSNDALVTGTIAVQLPFIEEQQIDAVTTFAEREKKTVILAFDPARLLDEVDFDLVSNGVDFSIDVNNADPNAITAFNTIVDNIFTPFAFVSFQ